MSTTLERALGILVVAALGGAGVFTQCGDPSDAPTPERRGRARASRGGPAFADVADEGGASAAHGFLDGGAPPEDDDEPPRCWSVRVVDPTGRPTAALVLVTPRLDGERRPGDRPQELRAPASGEVELCTTAWVDVDVDAWTDDGGWGRSFAWIGGPDDEPLEPAGPVEVVVLPPTAVRGRVVDPRGAPVAGARVHAAYDYGHGILPCDGIDESLAITGAVEHRTGADGRFELAIGRLGLYTICASREGFVTAAAPIAARPGAELEVELALEAEARFAGVVEHDGRPIPGASVRVSSEHVSATVEVADDGAFDVGGFSVHDRLEVHVWAAGHVARSFDLLPVGGHRLALDRGAALTVRVALAPELAVCARELPYLVGDWRPVHDVAIEVRVGQEWIGAQAHDPTEGVRLTELPPGPTIVSASAYGMRAERTVTTTAGEPTEVTLPLDPGAGNGILQLTLDPEGTVPGLTSLLRREDPGGVNHLQFLDPGEPSCRVEGAGLHRIFSGDQLVASPRVVAGQVTREVLRLPPVRRAPPPEDEHACEVPVDTVHFPNRAVVAEAAPGTGLFPGDELLEVEEGDDRWGPPGTSARLRVRRPDGSEATLTIPRTRCD